jgi:hypothetical protein
MINILSAMREYFVFTTTRNKEPRYYEQPISSSAYFRAYTTGMVCAEIIGVYVGVRYWTAIPWMSGLLLIATLLSLVGAWVRAIANHTRIKRQLADGASSLTSRELLKEVAGETNIGLALLSSIVLALIFAWAFTIAHYEGILAGRLLRN